MAPYLSVFTPNTEKYGPEKLFYDTFQGTFHALVHFGGFFCSSNTNEIIKILLNYGIYETFLMKINASREKVAIT